jgi:hypothetical protein
MSEEEFCNGAVPKMPYSVSKYSVVVVTPPGYVHASALQEIAETLYYGLIKLGFEAQITESLNEPGRRSIVLGAHLLGKFALGALNSDAIVFNMEQFDAESVWVDEAYLNLMFTHEVWDYSELNIHILRKIGLTNVHHLPLGYAAELERIDFVVQDIDVLFYGSLNSRRQKVFDEMRAAGINFKHLFGVYGTHRDSFIARAKIVLNVHFYESKIFEVARVSYLLTNGVCVLSEMGPDPIENKYVDGVVFSPYENLTNTCLELLNDPLRRNAVALQGQLIMRSMPQEYYLKFLVGCADKSVETDVFNA